MPTRHTVLYDIYQKHKTSKFTRAFSENYFYIKCFKLTTDCLKPRLISKFGSDIVLWYYWNAQNPFLWCWGTSRARYNTNPLILCFFRILRKEVIVSNAASLTSGVLQNITINISVVIYPQRWRGITDKQKPLKETGLMFGQHCVCWWLPIVRHEDIYWHGDDQVCFPCMGLLPDS